MLSADHLPELGSDLVPTLPTLNVQDFTHFLERERVGSRVRKMGFWGEKWDWVAKRENGGMVEGSKRKVGLL